MASLKRNPIKLLLVMCLIMLGVHVANVVLHGFLSRFAIIPGNVYTLHHIFLAPWLHGDWQHLSNNLVGFVIFSALVLMRGVPFYIKSSFIIITLTGLLVWTFGRHAHHLGASGWIFGLWSLTVALAWFQRNFLNIVIAIFVIVFYGGMIWGVLPQDKSISFESHLFGAVAGVISAYLLTRRNSSAKRR